MRDQPRVVETEAHGSFRAALRRIRENLDYSQAELAAEWDKTQAWYSRLEAGKIEPSLALLEELTRHGLRLQDGRWHVDTYEGWTKADAAESIRALDEAMAARGNV